MAILKGELQADNGDILYPHTTSDVVFMKDGKTIEEAVKAVNVSWGGISGKPSKFPPSDHSHTTVSGIKIYKTLEEVKSGYNEQTPLSQVIKDMADPSILMAQITNATGNTYPQKWGNLFICKTNDNRSMILFTNASTEAKHKNILYYSHYHSSFTGEPVFKAVSDADTVDGKHASDFVGKTGDEKIAKGSSYKEPSNNWALKVINGKDESTENGLFVASRYSSNVVDAFRVSTMWNNGLSENPKLRVKGDGTTWIQTLGVGSIVNVEAEIGSLKSSVSNGKKQVANAITAKGVATSTTAEFATMAYNIGKIETLSFNTLVNNEIVLANVPLTKKTSLRFTNVSSHTINYPFCSFPNSTTGYCDYYLVSTQPLTIILGTKIVHLDANNVYKFNYQQSDITLLNPKRGNITIRRDDKTSGDSYLQPYTLMD